MRRSRIVTLTTDFGLRDSYVAQMKAAILSIAAGVTLVDVTHDVAAQDVVEAALALESAVPVFPAGTVHVAVVDPGVGTARRGMIVDVAGHVLVGPDNGLFTPFLVRDGARAFALTAERFRRPDVSATFHGRDIFGPAAAHAARGVAPRRFGPRIDDPVMLPWPHARRRAGDLSGEVVHVDRFGNLVTSIRGDDLPAVGSPVTVKIRGRTLHVVRTYGDLASGRLGALIGSSGRLEVSANRASAARLLGARRGTEVAVSPSRTPTIPRRPNSNRRRS